MGPIGIHNTIVDFQSTGKQVLHYGLWQKHLHVNLDGLPILSVDFDTYELGLLNQDGFFKLSPQNCEIVRSIDRSIYATKDQQVRKYS